MRKRREVQNPPNYYVKDENTHFTVMIIISYSAFNSFK